jgi:hypothetical protein
MPNLHLALVAPRADGKVPELGEEQYLNRLQEFVARRLLVPHRMRWGRK